MAPLQIPSWLFKNLIRKDRDIPLTANQVACILEVHPKTVQRWIRRGLIKRFLRNSRDNKRFAIAEVVDALLNTPKLQRLFNRKGAVISKPEYAVFNC